MPPAHGSSLIGGIFRVMICGSTVYDNGVAPPPTRHSTPLATSHSYRDRGGVNASWAAFAGTSQPHPLSASQPAIFNQPVVLGIVSKLPTLASEATEYVRLWRNIR